VWVRACVCRCRCGVGGCGVGVGVYTKVRLVDHKDCQEMYLNETGSTMHEEFNVGKIFIPKVKIFIPKVRCFSTQN
jgi:hypothetical protein